MKKISTVATKQAKNVPPQKLTVGLDLGDRWSWYCVLDEAGKIRSEQRVSTTSKAIGEVFGGMPRSRIALEIGTHSPWVSRLLRVRARSDRGECAQGAADRGEPQERRSSGCADAGAVGPDRSGVAVSGEAPQRAGAGRSHDDSGTGRTGAGTNGAGQHGSWTGEVLRRKIAQLQRAQYESGESGGTESGTATRAGTVAGGDRRGERTNLRVQRAHRAVGGTELSANRAAETGEGGGHADRADVHADAGRSASLW